MSPTPVQPLLQRPALRKLLHDVKPAIAHVRADKTNHMGVTVEQHEDLDLAQYFGGPCGTREAIERDELAAQHMPVALPPHHPRGAMRPLAKYVQLLKLASSADLWAEKLCQLHGNEVDSI